MEKTKDIEWFRKEVAPNLTGYELSYRYFKEGDFGALSQVEFNSTRIGGNVDFWGLGWLGVFVWSFEKEETMMNVLLQTHQNEEKEKALEQLQVLLK